MEANHNAVVSNQNEPIGQKNKESAKERLWNANYCKAMVGNFMLFFSFYLLTPLLPIYLDAQFAADKDLIGLVLSGYVWPLCLSDRSADLLWTALIVRRY